MRAYADLLRRNRDFRRVYLATLISLGGDWFAVIPLLNLLAEETGTGVWGGLVLAADTALLAALSPYAGSAADRWDRRRVMVTADLVSAALVMCLLLVRGPGTAGLAVAVVGAVAVAKSFYLPASSAALPNLVDPVDLPRANVLVGAAWGTMLAVGAALGGVAAAAFGAQVCFVLDAASFVLSGGLTLLVRKPFQQADGRRTGRPQVVRDFRETAAYLRAEPHVTALVTAKSGVGLGNGALTLFPVLAVSVYGVGALGTGLFFAARGLGALLGPLALRRYATDERHRTRVLTGSMVCFGLAYVVFGFTPWFAAAWVLVVVAHIGGGANWVLSSYGVQAVVPDGLRGRVFSVDFMLATCAMATSQLVAGWASDHVDVRLLASASGAVTLAYVVPWRLAARRARRRRGVGGERPWQAEPEQAEPEQAPTGGETCS